ncbi:autotransporter family protein, partial [Sutterella wadsworthensis]
MSEALHHKGKFTIGNMGEMTQDTGFMGIKGSTGITVKDGKTLTLMGSQASMAMAVGADTRDASYVITDAPMALENGTLKLGHKALSATEGTLAAVTYDRQSSVNVENGIYTLASLKGEGSLNLSSGARTDVTGELSATQVTNAGMLTVAGLTSLGATPEAASTYAAPKSQTFVNENGATANLTGGLVVNDFATVKNKTGATINAGAVTVDTFGVINNYEGATLAYASVDADGIVRNLGTLNVTGTYAIGDEGETTFAGDTKVGTLSIGRTAKTMLMARDGQEAVLHNTGKTYADELDLVSGQVMVEKDSILAGKSLKNGAVGSDIIVSAGGTFGFSHDKSSLENALKNYTGSKADKAILALSTDLHFGQGGSLTVGSVNDAKGTVNLGSDALLLLGTTQLHGEALLNGESAQHLHAEDGAVIAMTDDLLWGNHYLMKGFDAASTDEILKVGVLDKDGKKLETRKNDKGIFVTVGSDNILDKDKSYRLVNQMNWLLDGNQDLSSVHGDVAFLTNALVDKNGALATNRMEALAADSSALAETQRMGAQVQTTMLDHASSARKGYGTFWVDGIYSKTDSGDFTRFTRSTGAYGYEADTTGFAFGADLPMGDDTWRLGAAFSAQRGDLDGSYGLSSDIEGYGFSVYGGKTFSTCLNVSGALTYMTANHEVDAYNLGKVKADIDADMWVLGARMSMPFGQNRVWMTPYLGVDVMKLTQDGFTSSWSGMDAFRYSDVDATIVRTPVGVRAGTFMPLELFGRSGTVNWDADISFIPQFGDKDADFKVSGISNGHSDGMSAEFVNDWLSQAKFGMNYQGAAGAFGLYYPKSRSKPSRYSSENDVL